MFIEINTSDSTVQELTAMSRFFAELAGTKIPNPQPQHVESSVLESSEPVGDDQVVQEDLAPTVTRRRRTKAEIEAAKLAEAAAATSEEPAPEVVVEEPAPEPVVEEPKDEFEAAPSAGGKTYSEADVQGLATVVARSKGPEFVKNKINELGAPRIAALSAEQLNTMGAFLEANK